MFATFDGVADATAITTSNGNGDDFSAIASGLTASADAIPWAGVGAMGGKRTLTSTGSQSILTFAAVTGTVATRVVCCFWLYVPVGAAVTSAQVLSTIDVQSTGSQACQVKLTTGLKLRLAPAVVDLPASDSPALTAGAWYYVRYAATAGSTTTNGVAEMSVLNLDGTIFHGYSNAGVNCRQDELGRARVGGMVSTGVTGWTEEYLADMQLVRLASGWPTPIRRATIAPQAVVSASGFTTTGASSAPAALADNSDASYVDGSSGSLTMLLNPATPATQLDLDVRQQWVTSNPATKTLKLIDGIGGPTIKTWTLTPGSSLANQALQVTSELADVDNWDQLLLQLTVA